MLGDYIYIYTFSLTLAHNSIFVLHYIHTYNFRKDLFTKTKSHELCKFLIKYLLLYDDIYAWPFTHLRILRIHFDVSDHLSTFSCEQMKAEIMWVVSEMVLQSRNSSHCGGRFSSGIELKQLFTSVTPFPPFLGLILYSRFLLTFQRENWCDTVSLEWKHLYLSNILILSFSLLLVWNRIFFKNIRCRMEVKE